jgi:hypothetical protein
MVHPLGMPGSAVLCCLQMRGRKPAALPEGWTRHKDKKGQTYYFNKEKNTSTWQVSVFAGLSLDVCHLTEGSPNPTYRHAQLIDVEASI